MLKRKRKKENKNAQSRVHTFVPNILQLRNKSVTALEADCPVSLVPKPESIKKQTHHHTHLIVDAQEKGHLGHRFLEVYKSNILFNFLFKLMLEHSS